jgi:hypothetical protein
MKNVAPSMTERELEEYRALRATIRERGTARHVIVVAGLAGWAGLAIATTVTLTLPIASLIPLVVLAVTFQVTFALHTGVERIGRYIQVFHEAEDEPVRWERTAMAFGPHAPKRGANPLFIEFFLLAAVANVLPLTLAEAIAIEWLVVGAFHVIFAVHVLRSHRYAAKQRAIDLGIFTRLKAEQTASRN